MDFLNIINCILMTIVCVVSWINYYTITGFHKRIRRLERMAEPEENVKVFKGKRGEPVKIDKIEPGESVKIEWRD